MAYVLIQEGGASNEFYVHVHDTLEEAEADRSRCAIEGSYRTTDPIELPDEIADRIDWDVVEELFQSLDTLDYPEDDDEGEDET